MNLLITGVAGFIGSKISEAALRRGYKVYGVDDLSKGYESNIPIGVEFIKKDLSEAVQLDSLPKNIDVIMHLAGQSSGAISFDDPVSDLRKNTLSTINLIKYGINREVNKIIYASSMSVYGETDDTAVSEEDSCQPLSCYGIGKLAAENYLKIYQKELPFVVFRMFNVYGPGQDMTNLCQGMVSIFLQHAFTNKHIPVKGSTKRYRDFIFIDDVVKVWLEAINNDKAINHFFNLGTGVKTSVEKLLQEIKLSLPDISWCETENTQGDQFGIYANTDKLQKVFNFNKYISIKNGLRYFLEFLKKTNNDY